MKGKKVPKNYYKSGPNDTIIQVFWSHTIALCEQHFRFFTLSVNDNLHNRSKVQNL